MEDLRPKIKLMADYDSVSKHVEQKVKKSRNPLILNGGEYRNRTSVHGFAIQKERKRKQRLRGAKHPLTKSEQKAKVSKPNSPVQNEKGPVTAATVNRGQIEKACQLSQHISMSQCRTANAQAAFSRPLTDEVVQ